MGLFNFKKIKRDNKIDDIYCFMGKIDNLLDENKYIARSRYKDIIEKFKEIYNYFIVLKDSNLLKEYCKKNKIKNEVIYTFFDKYNNIHNLVKFHNEEFISKYMVNNKEYLDNILKDVDEKIVLDENQRRVVLTDEDYSLVVAGAGAGKTTTVAAKVKYLVEKKNIDPKEILIVSFTNKAVDELKERINDLLKIDCPITTFHSTGNAILRKQSETKLNIKTEGFLYNVIKNYLHNNFKEKRIYDNLLLFFGSYFDASFEGETRENYMNYLFQNDFSTLRSNLNEFKIEYINRNTKKKITINNEICNSGQEVQIANFLYMNGINYEYEPVYPYHIYRARKKYTPDFLIEQNGKKVYLEHFGISEDGVNNLFSKEEIEKYKNSIRDKIKIHNEHGTKLIYTFSKYNDNRDLLDHLKEILISEGFVLTPRDSKEVIDKLMSIEENKYFYKLIILMVKFINNFKVNGYTEDDFYRFIRTTKSPRTKVFLEICKECYLEYQKSLAREDAVDFQDMINDAARILRDIDSIKQKLSFKYIIVDEYQDISRQRFDLVKELSKVCDAKIMVVGDDWQSIFAFSGSNVSLFTKFKENVGYCEEIKIVNTYRNSQEVIDIAGNFIQKNSEQIKKELISPKHIDNPVFVMTYDDNSIKYDENGKRIGREFHMAEAIEKAIDHIVNNSKNRDGIKILLIGRYNFEAEKLSRTNKFIDNKNGTITSLKYPKVKLDFLTAHSSKGLGYDNVIIINAIDAVFGFPSKIETDPIMKLVIYNNSEEIEYAEERRLFYVAMTRTKNRVYIIAPETHPSQFVMELVNDYPIIKVEGKLDPHPKLLTNKLCPICGFPLQRRHKKNIGLDLWVCTNENEICGFVSNNLKGGKMAVHKCTMCEDGYLIVKTKDGRAFLGCTNYNINGRGCNNVMSSDTYDIIVTDDGYEENDELSICEDEDKEVDFDKKPKYNFVNICLNIIEAYRTLNKYKQYYGVEKLCKYLRGSRDKNLLAYDSINEEYYGMYNELTKECIINIINWLIEKNIFSVVNGFYPTLRLINEIDYINAREFIGVDIEITLINIQQVQEIKNSEKLENEDVDLVLDETLYELLRKKRMELAIEYGLSPAYVASNKLLMSIVQYLPRDKESYLLLKGTGERSFEKFGKHFIEVVNEYLN